MVCFSCVSPGCTSLSLPYLFYLFFFLYIDIFLFLMDFLSGMWSTLLNTNSFADIEIHILSLSWNVFLLRAEIHFYCEHKAVVYKGLLPLSPWDLLSVTVSIRLWAIVLWVPMKLCSNSYSEALRVGKCRGT